MWAPGWEGGGGVPKGLHPQAQEDPSPLSSQHLGQTACPPCGLPPTGHTAPGAKTS
ncbi:unnamed protein product, partial [Gulo gulo]